ncbi:hypothetical protein FD04_GL002069 [Secundilactobacillus odoratitofui DSM 19909 = JCM 15043]|uniref:DUF3862 domain-containing protein n=2 Tax=Secundilactobacillus odoratitofui TaxID=480930 RepID=A0A0R1LZM4_9LACO|nr:hypothetical protein FD04_GL002069 [Secundilactobacillus odoratitofui DSM 19909 = JCM 15043]
MDKYNSIKLGSMTTGSGGSTEKLVKSMYGKPSSETETDIPGSNEKSKSYTWSNVGSSLAGATVTTEFINGKAIGKGYADFGKSTKISLGTYDTLQTGTSFKAVKQQLGVPLTESIVGVTGITSAQTLTYTSKDGKDSLMLMFTNNKLTSKTKTSI